MDPQRWRRAARVFEECRERPRHQRRAALLELCAADESLRSEVEELLDAHEREEAATSGVVSQAARRIMSDAEPVRLGPYTIRERLGAGGMGVVYRAEQASPRRDVALKVLPAWLWTDSGRARFEFEAQALGRLDHPNIARIYEAGAARDERGVEHAYFAMELVQGRSLDEAAARMTVRERVALLETVGRAVHHAHQRGVIHRDLKPSNILVDEAGSPRVLDFGIARVVDAERAGGATVTGQIVGTVQYMSPEQATGDPARIDIRTDVYALGVILYQALSGRLPHKLDGLTLLSALHKVSDAAPEPLGDIDSPLQRDLEVILAKAMAKDPHARYASAAAFADDLSRALRHEPILAHPPSRVYAMRKFVARNRPLVALSAAAMIGLAAGAVSLAVGLMRAQAAEAVAIERLAEAEREANKAQAVREILRNILVSANPENTEDRGITVREVLDVASAELIENQGEHPPEVLGAALWSIGWTYRSLGEPELAERTLLAAVETLRPASDPGELAGALGTLAGLRLDQNQAEAAEALYREAIEIAARHEDEAWRRATLLDGLGLVVQRRGATEEALELFREATPLHAAHYGDPSLEVATNLNNVGFAHFYLDDMNAAADAFERVLDMQLQLVEESHPQVLRTLANLGTTYQRLGRLSDALDVHRRGLNLRLERLGPEHPDLFYARYGVARALSELGEHELALEQLQLAIPVVETAWGPTHPLVARAAQEAGSMLIRLDRYDEAYRNSRRAHEVHLVNENHTQAVRSLEDAALALQAQGRIGAAHDALAEAETYCDEHLSGDAGTRASLLISRALLHLAQERFEDAAELLAPAVTLRREALGPTHGRVGEALSQLGDALVGAGRASEAEAALTEAESILLEAVGESHWLMGETRATLGMARLALGSASEAAELIAGAWPLIEGDAGPSRLARVAGAMAEALEAIGDPASAEWSARRDALLAGTAPADIGS